MYYINYIIPFEQYYVNSYSHLNKIIECIAVVKTANII